MLVLLDLEWIGEAEKHLTQLSAYRVDPDWRVVDRMDAFCYPSEECLQDPDHIAFGGCPIDWFENGLSEQDGIINFATWLNPSDTIWVWSSSNRKYFKSLWTQYVDYSMPHITTESGRARSFAARRGYKETEPYSLLTEMGRTAPTPKHRSANDVNVFRQIYSLLDMKPRPIRTTPAPPPIPTPKLSIREQTAELVDKTDYNFIYVPGSKVFHRRGCRLYLGAKTIHGSKYYETAAKEHRPCKCCKPTPEPLLLANKHNKLFRAEDAFREYQKYNNEAIICKLVDGSLQSLRRRSILGWCQCNLHPGVVDKGIAKAHACLKKNCSHFLKNPCSTFLAAQANAQQEKEKQKRKKKEAKEQRAREADDLRITQETWQAYIDELDYDMLIVRVEKSSIERYTVFYVSDNPFADGNLYPDFLETIKSLDPKLRVRLRHIKDMEGRFVTTAQYRARPRK